MEIEFDDRVQAGQMLAAKLTHYSQREDVLILALPRGGVPVAYEVARRLKAPLDVFLVRKLGVPGQEELAMGAIASGGIKIVNREIAEQMHISPDVIQLVARSEQDELSRRERLYRGNKPSLKVDGLTVILIDDGLATGSSMRAAVAALRQRNPARIVVAVPVAAWDTCEELGREVDEIVCLSSPDDFQAVGRWYRNFSQISDSQVRELLERAELQIERPHPAEK